MNEMSSLQKAMALRSLDPDFCVQLRQNGSWYARASADVRCEGLLKTPSVAEPTPEQAVCALFDRYAAPDALVVVRASSGGTRTVTWTGHMWSDVP